MPRGGRPGLRCPTTSTRAATEQPMLSTVVDLVGVRLEAATTEEREVLEANKLETLEYEIVGQFQENEEDELANHGVAWVDMEAMVAVMIHCSTI